MPARAEKSNPNPREVNTVSTALLSVGEPDHRPAPPRLKLYEATEALHIVGELLVESEGELTPEIEELLAQAGEDFDAKAERVALMTRELAAESEAIALEAARLVKRKNAADRAEQSLKDYLCREMQRAERPSIKRPLVSMSVRTNPPRLVGADTLTEEKLRALQVTAPDFVKVIPETVRLNTAAVVAAWKANRDETQLPAGLSIEVGAHVRIS